MNKFFYKSIDINDMIASGTTPLDGYNLSYNKTVDEYKKVRVGFAANYMIKGNVISSLDIEGNSTTLTDTNNTIVNITKPVWSDSFKIYMETTNGLQGEQGMTGLNGETGLQGEQGGSGRDALNRTYQGGYGGLGGPGGEGGQGGIGGIGGTGVTTYTSNIYSIDNTTVMQVLVNSTTCSFKAQTNNTQIVVDSYSGIMGQSGGTGLQGLQGGQGGSGGQAQGQRNGRDNFDIGSIGLIGDAGLTGNDGAAGTVTSSGITLVTSPLVTNINTNAIKIYFFKT